MKITVLCNDKAKEGFLQEHGLSLLLDDETLFDTGASDVAVLNAERLGVDFKKIKRVVISHGHYDHGGGLLYFLERTGKIDVYVHEKALNAKYSGTRFAGFPFNWKDVLKKARVHLIRGNMKIGKMYLLNEIPTNEQLIDERFIVDGHHDLFEDELNLYVDGTIITGCAHRGIDNIVGSVKSSFEVNNLVGGFHLKDSPFDRIKVVTEFLESLNVKVFPMHCTGKIAVEFMKKRLGEMCISPLAGEIFEV